MEEREASGGETFGRLELSQASASPWVWGVARVIGSLIWMSGGCGCPCRVVMNGEGLTAGSQVNLYGGERESPI